MRSLAGPEPSSKQAPSAAIIEERRVVLMCTVMGVLLRCAGTEGLGREGERVSEADAWANGDLGAGSGDVELAEEADPVEGVGVGVVQAPVAGGVAGLVGRRGEQHVGVAGQ